MWGWPVPIAGIILPGAKQICPSSAAPSSLRRMFIILWAGFLYAHPHVPLKTPGGIVPGNGVLTAFVLFLSINSNMTIEKDGEIYEEKGLDRDTLSGKNFIL